MESSSWRSGGGGSGGSVGGASDPFDIPAKGAPVERLKKWRQATLVLNAARRFRYTLNLKREEQKEEVIKKIRVQAHVIRAAFRFQEAGRVVQPKEITVSDMFHTVRPFLADLFTKWYQKDHVNMPQEQVMQSVNNRLTGYITICCMGLGNMYWGGATTVLSEMHKSNPDQAYYCAIYFQSSLLLMLLGVTAGTFPSSSPLAAFFSGLGAWQAIVFMLSSFHLGTLDYYREPKIQNALISFGVTSAMFTMYWACNAQDPLFLHVIAKLVGWLLYGICFLLSWLLRSFWLLCELICKGVGVLFALARTRVCQVVPPTAPQQLLPRYLAR